MNITPNYLSASGLARRLNVCQGTILRWIASGKLTPAAKLGKTLLFTEDQISNIEV